MWGPRDRRCAASPGRCARSAPRRGRAAARARSPGAGSRRPPGSPRPARAPRGSPCSPAPARPYHRGHMTVPTDAVSWLYGLQHAGVKLGLEGIRALLSLLDHPEREYPSALVGGTNGKGSTAATLDALLLAHGRSTGLYTSPHLVRPNERIRLGGRDLEDAALD